MDNKYISSIRIEGITNLKPIIEDYSNFGVVTEYQKETINRLREKGISDSEIKFLLGVK